MRRRPPRSTLDRSSAASDVYKRQLFESANDAIFLMKDDIFVDCNFKTTEIFRTDKELSLIHISEPTRPY